jgi:hypothetical protein
LLDHVVTLPDGEAVLNPMRVHPNSRGSEVVFSLHQRDGQPDKAFAEDAAAVERDLHKLMTILGRKDGARAGMTNDRCGRPVFT